MLYSRILHKHNLQRYPSTILRTHGGAYGAPNRVKGLKGTDSTPQSINARHYTRYVNSEGKDSIASSDREEDIQALSFWNIISSIPFDLIEETDKIKKWCHV